MLTFVSPMFWLLMLLVVVVFHTLPLPWRPTYLLVMSYGLYAIWEPVGTALLGGATLIGYFVALRIAPLNREPTAAEPPAQALRWLTLGVVTFISSLVFFKYVPPLVTGRWASFIAPIGLSYYTFRLVSYVVDVYWEKYLPERSLVKLALYVSFFPQIVSGPIQQPKDFLEQIAEPRVVSSERVISGLRLILFGLFKKIVVSNWLSVVVGNVFDAPHSHTGLAFLVGAYAFAFQLYADFSGLTDIALGLGRLFGISGPRNFDSPFYAPNIQSFWRRWHMSLTSWLGIYVFTPLRMLFRNWGTAGLTGVIMINMMLIGLWHAASWPFLAFGILNGIYMVVSVMTLKSRDKYFMKHPRWQFARTLIAPLITFHLVVIAFVFVRAHTLSDAWWIISHLVPTNIGGDGMGLRQLGLLSDLGLLGVLGIPVMEFIHFAQRRPQLRQWIDTRPVWFRWANYYVIVVAIFLFGHHDVQGFIYAQF